MLWIEKYRPQNCEDLIGQDPVAGHIGSFAASGSIPHLLLAGPHGTGKTAALECLARRLYPENWQVNTTIIPTTDLFSGGKNYLAQDERFSHLYQKDASLITNFKHVVKWYASLQPLDAPFKLVVFDDAAALNRDAQQALRRIMERYSATCRFVFITTRPSALIPAITSRCLLLSFLPISGDLVVRHLRSILVREAPSRRISSEDLELIAKASRGDLRMATMLAQLVAESRTPTDIAEITESETRNVAASVLSSLRKGELAPATKCIESLLIDYGLSGAEVLADLRRVIQRDYNDPRLAILLAETDSAIARGGNEFIQLNALLATALSEVAE
jgi:replication factor C small subunit